MRYIPKGSTEPPVLSEAKAKGEDYASFRGKSALNKILREDQGHICCYCQQEIQHYGTVSAGSSHNEHLQPQHPYYWLDMDYSNLFASCNADGKAGYCGHHKGNEEITDFIRRKDCREHFKYNVIGEILPEGSVYNRWEEYTKNYSSLSPSQQEAADAIRILNLNHPFLVAERRKTIGDILALAQGISSSQAQHKIAVINRQTPLVRFVEAIIYFLNKKIP
jgi:uncharacterized protein (TIGR02646 family)